MSQFLPNGSSDSRMFKSNWVTKDDLLQKVAQVPIPRLQYYKARGTYRERKDTQSNCNLLITKATKFVNHLRVCVACPSLICDVVCAVTRPSTPL